MIPVLGTGGRGFNSRKPPIFSLWTLFSFLFFHAANTLPRFCVEMRCEEICIFFSCELLFLDFGMVVCRKPTTHAQPKQWRIIIVVTCVKVAGQNIGTDIDRVSLLSGARMSHAQDTVTHSHVLLSHSHSSCVVYLAVQFCTVPDGSSESASPTRLPL